MEAFSFESHQRAIRATDEGRFGREIEPVGDLRHDGLTPRARIHHLSVRGDDPV